MNPTRGSEIIKSWPEESREAAQLVIDRYGEPHEATDSLLIWHHVGPWKRMVASRTFHRHEFPAPHVDAVESFIDYRVPPEKVTALAEFDGSVVVERTAVSGLTFSPADLKAADPDRRLLSDEELQRAAHAGKAAQRA